MHEVCLNPPPTPPFPQRPVARSFKPTQARTSTDAQLQARACARAHTDIMWHSGLTLMNVCPSEGTTDTESDTLGTRTGEETKRKGGVRKNGRGRWRSREDSERTALLLQPSQFADFLY